MVKEPISRLSPTENKKPACSSFGTGGLLKSTLWIHRRQCDLRDLFFLSRSLPARAHHVRCKSRSPVSSFESPPPLWASPHATCVRSARIAHVRFRGHHNVQPRRETLNQPRYGTRATLCFSPPRWPPRESPLPSLISPFPPLLSCLTPRSLTEWSDPAVAYRIPARLCGPPRGRESSHVWPTRAEFQKHRRQSDDVTQ